MNNNIEHAAPGNQQPPRLPEPLHIDVHPEPVQGDMVDPNDVNHVDIVQPNDIEDNNQIEHNQVVANDGILPHNHEVHANLLQLNHAFQGNHIGHNLVARNYGMMNGDIRRHENHGNQNHVDQDNVNHDGGGRNGEGESIPRQLLTNVVRVVTLMALIFYIPFEQECRECTPSSCTCFADSRVTRRVKFGLVAIFFIQVIFAVWSMVKFYNAYKPTKK